MSELVTNCPRCGTKQITFDLMSDFIISNRAEGYPLFESFCICRECKRSSIFVLSSNNYLDTELRKRDNILAELSAVISFVTVERHISQRDEFVQQPPKYLPESIEKPFREGAACTSIGCYNAAGTMFRLCIDLATKDMLPESKEDNLILQGNYRSDGCNYCG